MKKNLILLSVASAFALSGPVRAGDPGHYVGGLMDIRDYFVPDPGFYAGLYNYFYNTDRYNDQNGNKVSSVTINHGPLAGTTVDASLNVHEYAFVPVLIWVSPWKVLGAKYGAYVAPTFANAQIQNAVSTSKGFAATGSEATFAPGDMFVQPVWLGWTLPHWDVSAARLRAIGKIQRAAARVREQGLAGVLGADPFDLLGVPRR